MRLSVQGSLIFLLVSYSSLSYAQYAYDNSGPFTFGTPESAALAIESLQGTTSTQVESCTQDSSYTSHDNIWGYCDTRDPLRSWVGNRRAIYYQPPSCDNPLTHEPGGPVVGSCPSQCEIGYVRDLNDATSYDCIVPRDPAECFEDGLAYDSKIEQCAEVCEFGVLNGVCTNPPPENEEECSSDSPDYKGYYGFGNQRKNFCSSNTDCGDGGTFGIVGDELRCVPNEYNPPECSGREILVVGDFGTYCRVPDGAPEEAEEPNTDTDGDGQPDEYRRENDPESVDKALDRLNESSKQTNESLEGISKGISEGNKKLDDIADGVGGVNSKLDQINEKLDPPDGGYSTDGLGTAPEFGHSVGRLKDAIFEHPTIQVVTTIPTIGTSTSCPTWTIPANEYWDALTLDVHCSILEDHRATLSMMFLFFWTVVAIFLFLRA